jgi:poly(A) polymerase
MRSLQHLCDDLNDHPFIRRLADLLSSDAECYLVGGAIRDLLLDRPCNDFDFVTPFDPSFLAQTLARQLRGTWFYLDRKRCQSRLLIALDGQKICCDFGMFRATSLTSDLLLRDFKINAMAMRIRKRMRTDGFWDPLSGFADLRASRLTICSENVLQNDPLRILKGLRHCHALHLHPACETVRRMREAVMRLGQVAAERKRKELGLLFGHGSPAEALTRLIKIEAAGKIFGSWIQEEEYATVVSNLEKFDRAVRAVCAGGDTPFFRKVLQEKYEEYMSRRAVFHLAVVLRRGPYPEADAERLINDLKLARNTARALRSYLRISSCRLMEAAGLTCGFRGRYWWVSSLGPDPVGGLVFLACLAWERCRKVALDVLALLEEYVCSEPLRDLVDGHWITRSLGIEAGPRVGEVLRVLRQEEIAGRVCSKEEAKAFLLTRYQKTD